MNSQNAEQFGSHEPAYLADYGLSRVPFAESHEDRFLYLDSERAQRLNLIQHTLQYNNLLLLVKGDAGVGKTSLMTRFVRTAASDVKICVVTANPLMDAGQLLYQAAKGFDVRRLPQNNGDLQGLLYEHIAGLHHMGRIPVLVVDDAHTLPKDALLALYNLADAQVGNDKLVRVILFCTPQMDKILSTRDMRAVRERVTHNMVIPPFDEVTTAGYLKHRLAVAGFNGSSPFTPNMVKRIYKASAGIPARINQLALEALDRGNIDREEADDIVMDNHASGRRSYRRVFAILVVIIALAVVIQYRLSHVLNGNPVSKSIPVPMSESQIPPANSEIRPAPAAETAPSSPASPGPATQSAVATPATEPAPTALTAEASGPREQKIIPLQPQARSQSESTAAPAGTEPRNPAPASVDQLADEQTQAPVASAQSAAAKSLSQGATPTVVPQPQVQVESIEPNPVPASRREQTLIVHGKGFTQDSRVYVSWTDHDQEIPPHRVKFINAQRLEVALTVGSGDQHWQLRVNDREHGNSNSLRFNVATLSMSTTQQARNDWVRSQDPTALTLQLFGSHDLENAEAFIQQHHLEQQAHYFLTSHNGEDWYSVVYGVYPDQSAAHKAIASLPVSLSRIKPWIRRFGDVQSGMGVARAATASTGNRTVKPPKAELASAGTAPKDGEVSQNESWIWSQDPSSFTLQLMGAHDETSIRQFLHRYQDLAGKLVYFHSRHDGREWYTVIYGVYADKQQASDAIRRLPSALQKASPWIRKYASIHAELSRTN